MDQGQPEQTGADPQQEAVHDHRSHPDTAQAIGKEDGTGDMQVGGNPCLKTVPTGYQCHHQAQDRQHRATSPQHFPLGVNLLSGQSWHHYAADADQQHRSRQRQAGRGTAQQIDAQREGTLVQSTADPVAEYGCQDPEIDGGPDLVGWQACAQRSARQDQRIDECHRDQHFRPRPGQEECRGSQRSPKNCQCCTRDSPGSLAFQASAALVQQ